MMRPIPLQSWSRREEPAPSYGAAGVSLRLWSAPARLLDAEAAGTMLAGLPFASGAEVPGAPHLIFGGDLRYWSAAAALAQEMLVRQWYIPGVVELPCTAQLGYGSYLRSAGPPQPSVGAYWYAALAEPEVAPRFETLQKPCPISRAPPSRRVWVGRRHPPRLRAQRARRLPACRRECARHALARPFRRADRFSPDPRPASQGSPYRRR